MTTKAWMTSRHSTRRNMIERTASASVIQDMAKTTSPPKKDSDIVFTITALIAPIGLSLPPKFTAEDFPDIHETVTLSINAGKIPVKSRCSCLGEQENGGFNHSCLTASHWVVEYGLRSKFRLDKDGKQRAGAMQKYDDVRKGGGKKIFITEDGGEDEWIWCVEDAKAGALP